MRLCAVTSATLLAGCGFGPRLAPSAAGCYAVQIDSMPAALRALQVPPLPTYVQLDTANGGQLFVPVGWLEDQGYRLRSAHLQLFRPEWKIVNGMSVVDRSRSKPFPPDTLLLHFGGPVNALTLLLGAEPSGDWRGSAFNLVTATPRVEPMVPVRLQRSVCGATRMGM